jgi:hypothetical protein
MSPSATATPQILVNGALAAELMRNLESLCVHVVDGQSSAEVVLVGVLPEVLWTAGAPEGANLTIRFSPDVECFSGLLREVEARTLPDLGHKTALFASGTSPEGSELPVMPLRFGAEADWGSLRRGAQSSTAHVVSTESSLRWHSRISLTTPDPAFGGQFEIVELWYRFDAVRGLKVELIGNALV